MRQNAKARELLGIAMIKLYALNPEDYNRLWTRYHANFGEFLRNCMLGSAGFTPSHNEAQEELADISSKTINLYVGVSDKYDPSHSLTLRRGEDGLWHLQSPSIRSVNKATKAGVLAVVQAHAYGGGVTGWIPIRMQESLA